MRTLTTCEKSGTDIYLKKTGERVGKIKGSYVGGFIVLADADGKMCMLPFEIVDGYTVKD